MLEVGGAPPEPFGQIVRAYLAAPRQRRRTAVTRLRAALHLATAAVTRLPKISTALADLPHAALATESAAWRGSHLSSAPVTAGTGNSGAPPADATDLR